MSVKNPINAAIYARLAAASGLTALLANGTASLYYQVAPSEAVMPFVVWDHLSDTELTQTPKRETSLLTYFRGYHQTSAKAAADIDTQLHAALEDATLSITGFGAYWCKRASGRAVAELAEDNSRVYSAGGIYRIELTEA